MSYPVVPAPDDELAVIQYLRLVPAVTDLVPGARITTELPPTPVYPVLLVQRAGGVMAVPQRVDEPAIQIDAVGGTKAQCKRLMQAARAAILAIANDIVPEAVLSSAVEEVGPSWLPDTIPNPPLPRYTARFRVLLHNNS
ncbi:DUF3168 domain-containing protein [Leifsonia sp. NPDC058248]|uniref:tail completion protein gp17 n=1 Tax=Leifsonia sp. NPDC058248 TaxID=3346402 RepID=UPI0036D96D52